MIYLADCPFRIPHFTNNPSTAYCRVHAYMYFQCARVRTSSHCQIFTSYTVTHLNFAAGITRQVDCWNALDVFRDTSSSLPTDVRNPTNNSRKVTKLKLCKVRKLFSMSPAERASKHMRHGTCEAFRYEFNCQYSSIRHIYTSWTVSARH